MFIRMVRVQVREPAARALSAWTHFIWDRKVRPAENISLWVQPPARELVRALSMSSNYMLSYMCPHALLQASRNPVAECFALYDFVGVAERFDESLVVLRHKLRVSLLDLMYIPAKVSRHGGGADPRVVQKVRSRVTGDAAI